MSQERKIRGIARHPNKARSRGTSSEANEALLLYQQGRVASAQIMCEEVLRARPNEPQCLHLLGVIALKQGAFEHAAELLGKAIIAQPNSPAANNSLGLALYGLKKFDTAIARFEKVIEIDPSDAAAYINKGNALRKLNRTREALDSYDFAIDLSSDNPVAYLNRGSILRELNCLDPAIEDFHRAIALRPAYAEAYVNLGNALLDLKRFPDAIASFDKAIAISPNSADAHVSRACVLIQLNSLTQALDSLRTGLAIAPDHPVGNWNRALMELLTGNLETGWELYEWRWKATQRAHVRQFPQPLWLGDHSLRGKTILLHSEQGLGDTIQFCRYAKLVSKLGARVILQVQEPLVSALRELEGVDELLHEREALPPFDCHCPLMSLPLAFKTTLETVPASSSYLTVDPDKAEEWKRRLGPTQGFRVGLVWRGNSANPNDYKRSVPLPVLLDHLPDGFDYVGLQKEIPLDDLRLLDRDGRVRQFAEDLQDVSDTAALCASVDVVISVDTSVAHLAGALGRPTWIMLPFSPDWRWLIGRADSVWYPTVRLYRQNGLGDWEICLQKIRDDLCHFC